MTEQREGYRRVQLLEMVNVDEVEEFEKTLVIAVRLFASQQLQKKGMSQMFMPILGWCLLHSMAYTHLNYSVQDTLETMHELFKDHKETKEAMQQFYKDAVEGNYRAKSIPAAEEMLLEELEETRQKYGITRTQ